MPPWTDRAARVALTAAAAALALTVTATTPPPLVRSGTAPDGTEHTWRLAVLVTDPRME